MRIIIDVPEGQAVEYLELIAGQIEDGYTSGHVDRETHWEMSSAVQRADEYVQP